MAFPYMQTPYPYPMPMVQNYSLQQAQQQGGLIWVQGEPGAKSHPVGAGQSVLLMDSESNRFFIKTADASGMPLPLRVFDYTERKEAVSAPDSATAAGVDVSGFITREEFERRIQAILAQYGEGSKNDE